MFSIIFAFTNTNIALYLWLIFGVLMGAFFVVDLGVLNKTPKKLSTRAASIQAAVWVGIALLFGLFIYNFYQPEPILVPGKAPLQLTAHDAAFQYYTAYITEYALSVDNIFVIILILRYFHVEEEYHHKILFWGILGALIMRGVFIFLGATLIHQFHWILYIFGAFLLFTGFKMLFGKEEEEVNLQESPVIKLARKYLNFTSEPHNGKFFIKKQGVLYFTQLFLVVILIETTDLIFAVDSIPAVFSITQDEVVLYTSNVFAIMGLRAMFFLLAGIIDKFYLLKKGLSLVLMFIGIKMCMELLNWLGDHISIKAISDINFEVSTKASLLIIVALLGGSILLSLVFPKKNPVANE